MDIGEMRKELAEVAAVPGRSNVMAFDAKYRLLLSIIDALGELQKRTDSLKPSRTYFDSQGYLLNDY